ncbi:hypothetical protein V8C86DRAFT_433172 [Haematococcus lacustris]
MVQLCAPRGRPINVHQHISSTASSSSQSSTNIWPSALLTATTPRVPLASSGGTSRGCLLPAAASSALAVATPTRRSAGLAMQPERCVTGSDGPGTGGAAALQPGTDQVLRPRLDCRTAAAACMSPSPVSPAAAARLAAPACTAARVLVAPCAKHACEDQASTGLVGGSAKQPQAVLAPCVECSTRGGLAAALRTGSNMSTPARGSVAEHVCCSVRSCRCQPHPPPVVTPNATSPGPRTAALQAGASPCCSAMILLRQD